MLKHKQKRTKREYSFERRPVSANVIVEILSSSSQLSSKANAALEQLDQLAGRPQFIALHRSSRKRASLGTSGAKAGVESKREKRRHNERIEGEAKYEKLIILYISEFRSNFS
jgi:hypothetical protein